MDRIEWYGVFPHTVVQWPALSPPCWVVHGIFVLPARLHSANSKWSFSENVGSLSVLSCDDLLRVFWSSALRQLQFALTCVIPLWRISSDSRLNVCTYFWHLHTIVVAKIIKHHVSNRHQHMQIIIFFKNLQHGRYPAEISSLTSMELCSKGICTWTLWGDS